MGYKLVKYTENNKSVHTPSAVKQAIIEWLTHNEGKNDVRNDKLYLDKLPTCWNKQLREGR